VAHTVSEISPRTVSHSSLKTASPCRHSVSHLPVFLLPNFELLGEQTGGGSLIIFGVKSQLGNLS